MLLLGWLLYRIGVSALVQDLSRVGWGFGIVLALHGAAVFFNTLSWWFLLPDRPSRIPARALAPILIAGDGVNSVAPTALVGGEFVRFRLLARRLGSAPSAISVGLAAMSQFFGQVVFLATGLPLVIVLVREPALRRGVALFGIVMLALIGAVAILAWSRGGLERVGALLSRIPKLRSWWERRPADVRSLFLAARDCLKARPASFARSAAASFVGWQLGVVETYVILKLLAAPVSWTVAYAIEVLSVAIEGALFFVPAKMGTQEGGKVLIFLALNLDPAKGLALGVVRRLRELVWAAAGLAILGFHQRHPTGSSLPASPEPARSIGSVAPADLPGR